MARLLYADHFYDERPNSSRREGVHRVFSFFDLRLKN